MIAVPEPGQPPGAPGVLHGWRSKVRAAVRYSVQRSQLRLTVPITLVAGAVLIMVNMGGMLMHGRIDVGVCVTCAIDFVVPFLALNLGLLLLLRMPRGYPPPLSR